MLQSTEKKTTKTIYFVVSVLPLFFRVEVLGMETTTKHRVVHSNEFQTKPFRCVMLVIVS